ncbi:MAG TPA: hypothetical protein VGG14_02565 [Candidatus Sulfotelmatobacter sp.]|jgi:hypothetical protein
MSFPLEYHQGVIRRFQRSIPASIALSGAFLFFALPGSSAQANSAASFGASHVAAASHAAPPTHFYAVPPTGPVSPRTGPVAPPTSGHTHITGSTHNGNHNAHHTAVGSAYYPYIYALPVPYAVDTAATDDNPDDESADNDADYQGGPTIFDRRGHGPQSYVPPTDADSAPEQNFAEADPDPPQPPTTLVFKDGHQLEISNYAIVSQTLYDLTPGHPRKISLAELDLPATQKQNDDHGIVFQLPPSSQAN